MTLRVAFLVAAIVLGRTPSGAQTMPPGMNEPIVYVGVFNTDAEGRPGGWAAQTGERAGANLAGTVYLAPCGSIGAAASGYSVSASATDVWQLSGTVLELTADQAAVQIGWQRLRRDGRDEAAAPHSLTVTLKRGERSNLEKITVPASESCEARYASLDVTFATRQELFTRSRTSRAGTPTAGAGRARVFSDSRGGVNSTSIARPGQAAPTILSGDLWLVRTVPGRADETLHLTSPVVQLPQPFAFAPVTIRTATGTLTVKVEGTVEVGVTPEGERRFHFAANRTVTFALTSRPGPAPAPNVEGSTKMTVPVPGPHEVLEFEMPPLRIPGGASLPDRLSIRVRLRSLPMQEMTTPR
jgi:hypothetical protein